MPQVRRNRVSPLRHDRGHLTGSIGDG